MGNKKRRNIAKKLIPSPSPLLCIKQQLSSALPAIITTVRQLNTWQKIAATSAIATLIGAYVTLAPKCALDVPPALDAAHPFRTPFVLINNGELLAMRNVTYKCWEKIVQVTPLADNNGYTPYQAVFWRALKSVGRLAPGERASVPCIEMLGFADSQYPITEAEAVVEIQWQSFWVPFRTTRSFRFVTRKAKERSLAWFPEPIAGGDTVRDLIGSEQPAGYDNSADPGNLIMSSPPVYGPLPPIVQR